MAASKVFPKEQEQEQEQIRDREASPQEQLERQSNQLSLFRDLTQQAIRDIATIRTDEVSPRVQHMLMAMAAKFSQASKDSGRIQGVSMDAAKEQESSPITTQYSPTTTSAHDKFQQQKQKFVDEMVALGYGSEADIALAFDTANGVKEFAVGILISSLSFPVTPESQAGDDEQRWDATPEANGQDITHNTPAPAPVTSNNKSHAQDTPKQWDASPQDKSFQQTSSHDVHHAPITPMSRKRKAESSFPAPTSPATPIPTHSPCPPGKQGTYLTRRRPSSMSPTERSALFQIVHRLAPSNSVVRFWDKVRDGLAQLGFQKTEAAWKGEWSRYGTYEHGFDERSGVFVQTEVERLRLLRCLDNKPRAEVKKAIRELEGEGEGEEDDDDVIFVGSVKRQKMTGGFGGDVVSNHGQAWLGDSNVPAQEFREEFIAIPHLQDSFDGHFADTGGVGDGFASADGQAWLADFDLPQQQYDANVQFVEEVQVPTTQDPLYGNFSDYPGQQYIEEVQNFATIDTPHVDSAAVLHNDEWLDGAGFGLQDYDLFQNGDGWFSSDVDVGHREGDELNSGTSPGGNNSLEKGGNLDISKGNETNIEGESDLNTDAEWLSKADNPYIASLRAFERQMANGY